MKKRLVYITAILAVALFTGCGSKKQDESAELWTQIQGESVDEEKTEANKRTEDTAQINESVTSESITTEADSSRSSAATASTKPGLLKSTADIKLTDVDGSGANYTFMYDGEQYSAEYITDNWKIINSYKINNESDMIIICKALIDEKPVHGRDMESFRTADDMVYEWIIHNMAYEFLEDDDPMKSHAKDVDFDPEDQNRTFEEIYKDRTGKDFDLNDFLNFMN
ncbi:hypothetical protein [Butyrivibrio sp. WCD3002]|uniref:hypothetical protein n=1 Tax=Butyrivibrio sp. WCD3002 TaxID=1280676 RepID=UPI00040461FB|nr:hypothetical protein [Butyrivibrio sp. WCD3002]